MFLIERITQDALQTHTIVLPEDGSQFTFDLYFVPLQRSWYILNLTYLDFVINSLKVVNSDNILRQYVNQIPFGMACRTKERREPMFQEDFFNSTSSLYLLSESDTQEYEDFLSEQV